LAHRAAGQSGARSHSGPHPALGGGNPGDVKPVGSGVSELRIDYGPGYRLYFVSRGNTVVILLCGGHKRSQASDIAKAIETARKV
jgi:putative addiction module killer protein